MKEIESFKRADHRKVAEKFFVYETMFMHDCLKKLKKYGFTDVLISRHSGVNLHVISRFRRNQTRKLNYKNHKRLYDWLHTTSQMIITAENTLEKTNDRI